MTEVDDIGGKPPLGALFSTAASDNAEVVPPTAPRGPESMWSTEAPAAPPAADDEPRHGSAFGTGDTPPTDDWTSTGGRGADRDDTQQFGDQFTGGDGHQSNGHQSNGHQPNGHQSNGHQGDGRHEQARPLWDRAEFVEEGPFSAEPVSRDDDVIDAGDLFDPLHDDVSAWNPPSGSGSVFSSGAAARATPPRTDDSPWTMLSDEWDDTEVTSVRPQRSAPSAANGSRTHDTPPSAHVPPSWAERTAEPVAPAHEPVSDPHGLEAAVARLAVADQERAAVAIAVCGALLEPDELVAGVVTGQMLGRPAAVAVTDRRVIIANDRRWQPLVDVYRIDSKLVVRGRHDRQVAALSFADMTRLSMIDGITEVELAIELAERIRDSEPLD